MRYKQECHIMDPGCQAIERAHKWPATPPGRTGWQWVVLDSKGAVIGRGDPGNPNSAWRRAYHTLKERKS